MQKPVNVAILGVTGVVGQAMLRILEERRFPVNTLYPLASERSLGETVLFQGKTYSVQDASTFDFQQAQIGLFSAGAEVSATYAPRAAKAGCIVIDNTSEFRYQDDIPLVIAEVNPEKIADYKNRNIIANPNCSTMQLLVALKPIYDAVGIERINIATYQSVSGAGKAAIEELLLQTKAILEGKKPECRVYAQPIAFNLIPHIDTWQENGYCKEEMKLVWETQKILNDPNIKVNPTVVRVPVFYGHSEAVHIETREKITASDARGILSRAPGVQVVDDLNATIAYPTPAKHAEGTDPVYVGRIREDISHPRGLNLWIVSDNIRKGAALNAIQIAEILIEKY